MSRCIYCNSTTYGKPCLFSSTSTHVHFDSPEKCIYCGSKYLGGGCLYNPFGKNHIRGPEFLANVKENTEKSVVLKYLFENLNLNDGKFTSPLNRFYNRMCGIIASSSQSLLEALNLQVKPTYSNLTKDQSIKAFELKNRLYQQYNSINETMKHANLSLPQEIVEEILIDVILNNSEKTP
jgi:hypothetical protein